MHSSASYHMPTQSNARYPSTPHRGGGSDPPTATLRCLFRGFLFTLLTGDEAGRRAQGGRDWAVALAPRFPDDSFLPSAGGVVGPPSSCHIGCAFRAGAEPTRIRRQFLAGNSIYFGALVSTPYSSLLLLVFSERRFPKHSRSAVACTTC